ncbi:hypothetical protein BBO_06925 [Beauveria brongniartii RCEF 3172]|uniref:Uncharacterized protein n=1 Tax=Beauveria brongniartii RCEF 3172 TaxID=1081107 RepID=A0A162J2U2_9HYPO|nr:hypothetical protein BBO_06925 [Beauveria brongniartii RCEF 3172]
MPLYTCPGCKKPISESQPLDHCLQCAAMYVASHPYEHKQFLLCSSSFLTRSRNERQRARNQTRSVSVSEGSAETLVECTTIITVVLRRSSQQYGNANTAPRSPGSPPTYEDVFSCEAETNSGGNRPQHEAHATPRRGTTITIPIHIKRS